MIDNPQDMSYLCHVFYVINQQILLYKSSHVKKLIHFKEIFVNNNKFRELYEMAEGINCDQMREFIQELFKILMYVFSEGMKILYGDRNGNVNLDNLRAGDFREINKYFQSFSIDCKYEINDLDYVSERKATQENLSDIKIFIKTEKFYYSFWFNYL